MGQADRQLRARWLAKSRLAWLYVVACALLALALAAACENNQDIGETGLQPDGSYIIVGTEFAFEPATLEIPVNQETVIVFRNLGTVDHDLVIEEFDVATGTMRIGAEKTVRFTPTETANSPSSAPSPATPKPA